MPLAAARLAALYLTELSDADRALREDPFGPNGDACLCMSMTADSSSRRRLTSRAGRLSMAARTDHQDAGSTCSCARCKTSHRHALCREVHAFKSGIALRSPERVTISRREAAHPGFRPPPPFRQWSSQVPNHSRWDRDALGLSRRWIASASAVSIPPFSAERADRRRQCRRDHTQSGVEAASSWSPGVSYGR